MVETKEVQSEFPILNESVNSVLAKIQLQGAIDLLVTCGHCQAVTMIGQRCDRCGRYV